MIRLERGMIVVEQVLTGFEFAHRRQRRLFLLATWSLTKLQMSVDVDISFSCGRRMLYNTRGHVVETSESSLFSHTTCISFVRQIHR
jgi:hypothetical protein